MRLTLRGWACLILGLAWAAVAQIINEHDIIWPGLFLALLPVVSVIWMLPAFRRVRIQRMVPSMVVQAGDLASWEMLLDCPGLQPANAGELTESLPAAFGGNWQFWFGFGMGRRRHRFTVQATPHWRGRHLIGPATIRTTHALGMVRITRRIPGQSSIVVTPKVHLLDRIQDVAAGSTGIQTPVPKAGALGVDDALIREYHSGDDTRRIHWRSTAHHGDLMVRREEHAWDPDAVLLIDSRACAYDQPVNDLRLEIVVSLAASIGCHLFGDNWGLSVIDSGGHLHSWPSSGRDREREFLLRLTDLQQSPLTALPFVPDSLTSQLLIAVLGQLSLADAADLAHAHRDRNNCWALVLEDRIEDDALAVLRDAGWNAHLVSSDTTAQAAWLSFSQGPR
jgi:uncharacterized protein (DUF58 family)